ncbi:hypothetical protein GUY60_32955 [Streptomyces sp. YC537]|uniref:Uncharacterized protein n=1 Tax=Streptomyces boluensis TaxID=1775135 RepID=A0A964UVF2_9ACTN|nr:hypothetical protein [Streptomyces boluensis]
MLSRRLHPPADGAAAAQLDRGQALVEAVLTDLGSAPADERLRALLRIAAEVQEAARPVCWPAS